MPELPEVETIKRQLEKSIIGKKIKSAEINYPRFINNVSVKKFKKIITGAKIKNVRRRAKLLIIDLSNEYSLLSHLKMTGNLIFIPTGSRSLASEESEAKLLENKHTHIIYTFTDNSRLIHSDIRKFGYVKLIKTLQLNDYFSNAEYGIEPLEKNFTLDALKKILKTKPSQKIKQFLMDQKNIAGIGNIYADEILFFAGVHPIRIVETLNKREIKKLYIGIRKILSEAIKYRGSSVSDYRDSEGRAGEYHLKLKVYARAGQPCAICKTKISKIKLAGRGTHFCSKCQK